MFRGDRRGGGRSGLAGDAAAIEAQRAIDAVERGWRREVGAARYDAMKRVLRQLGRDQVG